MGYRSFYLKSMYLELYIQLSSRHTPAVTHLAGFSLIIIDLEIECPHLHWATHPRFVHETLIHTLSILLVNKYGFGEHHKHAGC